LNSAINLEPTEALTVETGPKNLGLPLRDSMVVLTQDASLISAVKTVSSPERELLFVGAETDLATQLLASSAGVAVLDAAATVSSIAQLTHSLKVQFPDVVLIVAGGAAEQSALTAQVSNGEVYRFLHKPASEQRVRLFVDAAWRRREKGDGATTTVQRLPDLPNRRTPIGLIAAAALGVAALAGLVGWLMGHHGTERLAVAAPAPVVIAAPPPAAPAVDTTQKDLLAHADAALARGDWVMPAGSSAADLYRQALEHHPGDPLALAGVDKVVDQLLGAAEQDLLAQHFDEAEHMTEAARTLAPNSPRIAFLTTQLAREQERATRAQAHQQAQQQQQASALAHQQELIASAQAALKAGKLNDAAQAIDSAAASGANKDAVEALRRDLQGARANALLQELVVKPATAAAGTEAAPAPQSPPLAQTQAQAQTSAASAPAALAAASPGVVPEPVKAQPDEAGSADVIVNAAALERLQYIAPEYPRSAREKGTSGWVQLAFDVEKDGSVAHIDVLASEPKYVFDEAAISALRRWRYRPVQKNGQPIEQRAQLRIRFALQ
jgi:TonB family protein